MDKDSVIDPKGTSSFLPNVRYLTRPRFSMIMQTLRVQKQGQQCRVSWCMQVMLSSKRMRSLCDKLLIPFPTLEVQEEKKATNPTIDKFSFGLRPSLFWSIGGLKVPNKALIGRPSERESRKKYWNWKWSDCSMTTSELHNNKLPLACLHVVSTRGLVRI